MRIKLDPSKYSTKPWDQSSHFSLYVSSKNLDVCWEKIAGNASFFAFGVIL